MPGRVEDRIRGEWPPERIQKADDAPARRGASKPRPPIPSLGAKLLAGMSPLGTTSSRPARRVDSLWHIRCEQASRPAWPAAGVRKQSRMVPRPAAQRPAPKPGESRDEAPPPAVGCWLAMREMVDSDNDDDNDNNGDKRQRTLNHHLLPAQVRRTTSDERPSMGRRLTRSCRQPSLPPQPQPTRSSLHHTHTTRSLCLTRWRPPTLRLPLHLALPTCAHCRP